MGKKLISEKIRKSGFCPFCINKPCLSNTCSYTERYEKVIPNTHELNEIEKREIIKEKLKDLEE